EGRVGPANALPVVPGAVHTEYTSEPAQPAEDGAVRIGRSGLPTLDPDEFEEEGLEEEEEENDEGGYMESSEPPPAETVLKTPLPSRPPSSLSFESERDAGDYLDRIGQRDAWLARAAWLREEADATEDKAARSRILLHVSELSAMAGDDEGGRRAAA